GLAVAAAVAGIGARGRIASIHRAAQGVRTGYARTSAAAEALSAAVPSTLQPSLAAVRDAERQPNPDLDVLVRIGAGEKTDQAVGRIGGGGGCRNGPAGHRLDARRAGDRGIALERRACRRSRKRGLRPT